MLLISSQGYGPGNLVSVTMAFTAAAARASSPASWVNVEKNLTYLIYCPVFSQLFEAVVCQQFGAEGRPGCEKHFNVFLGSFLPYDF